MPTSSPDTSSPAQDNQVDVTFIVRNDRHIFFSEHKWGYTTDALREEWVSCKIFEELDLPGWFQLGDIWTLSAKTRLLVVDCMIQSSQDISEWDWLSTWLIFAEKVRKAHPDLPIWLLDPFDVHEHLGIRKRAQASWIEQVYLSDAVPSVFLQEVKAVLAGTK